MSSLLPINNAKRNIIKIQYKSRIKNQRNATESISQSQSAHLSWNLRSASDCVPRLSTKFGRSFGRGGGCNGAVALSFDGEMSGSGTLAVVVDASLSLALTLSVFDADFGISEEASNRGFGEVGDWPSPASLCE